MEGDNISLTDDMDLDAMLVLVMNHIDTAEGAGAREDASLPPEAAAVPPDVPDVRPPLHCSDGEKAILSGYVSLMRQCLQLAAKMSDVKA